MHYIIVSGLPASGKSTIGRTVAAALGLVMLDKDEILEALFDARGTGDRAWRRHLSRRADEIFREKALHTTSAVLTSWWRHPRSGAESGTPLDWLSMLPGLRIELYCRCPAPLAAERFLARRRHPGHLDELKTSDEILSSFEQQSALGPLGVGRLIEINTQSEVSISPLLEQIELITKSSRH